MIPNSNCHLHAQVLSSHGGRLLLFHGWALEGVIPVLASGIAATRMASAPRGSLITASSTKASKTPTSLVHNVRRAQENGAGQGIRLQLMARSLAPRCVTTSGHLDVLAIVSLSRPCTTVRGVVSISVYSLASQHGKGNSAQPCLLILASPEDHRETMKEESPRVYLNSLRCARWSGPVCHPGAEAKQIASHRPLLDSD